MYAIVVWVLQWLVFDHLVRDPAFADGVAAAIAGAVVAVLAVSLAGFLAATVVVVLLVSLALVFARSVTASPREGLH